MSANDRQVGGTHYSTPGGLQHWDIVDIFKLDYFQGQITKYVMRWNKKNGVEDLKKAQHFLEKYIELNSPRQPTPEELAKAPTLDSYLAERGSYTKSTVSVDYIPPGFVGTLTTDQGPVDSDAQFKAEGWFGDGVVHYVCRHCSSIVYAKGLQRAHELHHCKSDKS